MTVHRHAQQTELRRGQTLEEKADTVGTLGLNLQHTRRLSLGVRLRFAYLSVAYPRLKAGNLKEEPSGPKAKSTNHEH